MEIAIPLILAGGLYMVSKDKNCDQQEGFGNGRKIRTICPPQIPDKNQLFENPSDYSNPTPGVDSFFTGKQSNSFPRNSRNNLDNSRGQSIHSLTGNSISTSEFTHNNMQPCFGSRIKQSTSGYDKSESIMDHYSGGGSQHRNKQEIAPLFKPQTDLHWMYGAPNQTEQFRERINPSLRMNNVKPFEEIKVAPNMIRGTHSTDGLGGFNNGMIGRDQWMPKQVDDLRVKSNPKQSYEGVVLGGKSKVTNLGKLGQMEKNRPDTYYINTPERYFTTTGIEKAPKPRSRNILKTENRVYTTKEHFGVPKHYAETYTKAKTEEPKRPELDPDIKHASNIYGPYQDRSNTRDIDEHRNSQLTNNRNLSHNNDGHFGSIATTVKAMFSPIVDVLRPSRKENVVGNLRGPGNAQGAVPKNTVFNPADRTKTTIREMTEIETGHRFVGNQMESAHTVTKHTPVYQHRQDTTQSVFGNIGNTSSTSNPTLYDAEYNAQLIDKSKISIGRQPTNTSVKVFNGQDNMNMQVRKQTMNFDNTFSVPFSGPQSTPSKELQGFRQHKSNQTKNDNRNHPDLLKPFQDNPYTQPLSSF